MTDAEAVRGSSVAASPCSDEAARLLVMPPPAVDAATAEAALRDHYGLAGTAAPLAGERDRNFMMTLADGTRCVLKVYHAAEDAATRAFQTGALVHLERVGVACAVPRLERTRDGAGECRIVAGGRDHHAILIGIVPGAPSELSNAGTTLRRDLGRTGAVLGAALASYDHPSARRVLLWDPMQLGRLAWLAERVRGPARRRWIAGAVERFLAEIRPRALALPMQVIHGDMNHNNVFVVGAAVSGVIDFGDMVRAPRVGEIAIAATYCLSAERDPVAAIGDVLDGYDAARPLREAEVELLYDLVVARLVVRILMYQWRAERCPETAGDEVRRIASAFRIVDTLAGTSGGAGRDALLERWAQRRRGP